MPVAVEKVQFPPKQPKFEGHEMPGNLRTSFVGHPSAILFLPISRQGVFQQPRLITSTGRSPVMHMVPPESEPTVAAILGGLLRTTHRRPQFLCRYESGRLCSRSICLGALWVRSILLSGSHSQPKAMRNSGGCFSLTGKRTVLTSFGRK
jgi:hypothetical protein